MDQPSTRASYRIVFPPAERPTITVNGARCTVLDCSELGIRYEIPAGSAPEVGAEVHGTVTFRTGEEVSVEGEVVRIAGDGSMAIRLTKGIPFAVLLAEQRRLRARYPGWG